MTLLLLSGIVRAESVEGPAAPPQPHVEEVGGSRDGGSSSGSKSGESGKKKSKSGDSGAKTFDKGKLWGWTYRPYVTPGGGVAISDGGTSIAAGADVGVRYWKKNWSGDLGLGASYTTGDLLNGLELRAGNEFGRREKWWGLSAGLVGFYNGYTSADGAQALDPSVGLDVPVSITVGPRKYYAYGNVTPAFLFNEDRHVKSLPFGDELEWGVGAGLKLSWINAEVGFNQRITTVGTISTPTLTLSLSGLE